MLYFVVSFQYIRKGGRDMSEILTKLGELIGTMDFPVAVLITLTVSKNQVANYSGFNEQDNVPGDNFPYIRLE